MPTHYFCFSETQHFSATLVEPGFNNAELVFKGQWTTPWFLKLKKLNQVREKAATDRVQAEGAGAV